MRAACRPPSATPERPEKQDGSQHGVNPREKPGRYGYRLMNQLSNQKDNR